MIAVLLIGCLALLVGPLAHADEPSTITATGELTGDHIVISGNLSSANGPVADVEILGEVDGEQYPVQTDADGNFEMRLDRPDGDAQSYEVRLLFEEQGDLDSSELRLTVGGDTPSGAEVVIEATLDSDQTRPDSLVAINGTVTSDDGAAAVGSQVDAAFNDTHQEASTTFTDDAGNFMTYVEIPVDEPEGEAQIVLSIPETDAYASASLTLAVTVGAPLSAPAAVETTDADAEAAEAVSTAPTIEPRETGRSTPAYHSGVWDWFWAVVVIVGGSALVVTFILIIRGMVTKGPRETDDADLLGDEGMLASQFSTDDVPESTDTQQPRSR